MVPLVKMDLTQQNFLFKSITIWNELADKVFEKCNATNCGLVIPGSNKDSDLAASTGTIKGKIKSLLLSSQKSGDHIEW